MASLKEVKDRILSVNSTLKITSAMKMVASAKLRKAQEAVRGMLPYERQLSDIMVHFLQIGEKVESPFSEQREEKRVALVAFSSNGSLCGAFNSNVIRSFRQWLDEHARTAKEDIAVYPVGRKIADAVKKSGLTPAGDFTHMADKPGYAECEKLAAELCDRFLSGDIDRVDFIYHHFKSSGSQELVRTTYLPIDLSATDGTPAGGKEPYYLIEPSEKVLLDRLIPEVLKLKVYAALLDSNASEHATRSMAMQIATDNANDLLEELTIMYNKGRQQAITNELLDIMGGTMA